MRKREASESSKQEVSKQEVKEKRGKATRYSAKDFVVLSIYSVFIIQQRGELTIPELQQVFKDEVNAIVHESTLLKVLEALRRKNFVVANLAGGEWRWGMGKVKFTVSASENAFFDGILPTLYDDPAGIAIKESIEAGIANKEGKKEAHPCEYMDYEATYILHDMLLGSQPLDGNPYLCDQIKSSQYSSTLEHAKDPKETIRVFERGPQGELRIHTECLQGAFNKHLPWIRNGRGIHIRYFFFEDVLLTPPQKLFGFRRLPIVVIDGAMGKPTAAGVALYEAVFAGAEVVIKFSAPSKNFIPPEMMKAWCGRWLRRYHRSISPARSRRCGGGEMINFTYSPCAFDIGPIAENEIDEELTGLDE
jgi:hypothetical protein